MEKQSENRFLEQCIQMITDSSYLPFIEENTNDLSQVMTNHGSVPPIFTTIQKLTNYPAGIAIPPDFQKAEELLGTLISPVGETSQQLTIWMFRITHEALMTHLQHQNINEPAPDLCTT